MWYMTCRVAAGQDVPSMAALSSPQTHQKNQQCCAEHGETPRRTGDDVNRCQIMSNYVNKKCRMSMDVLSFLLITVLLQADYRTCLGRLSSSTQAASSTLAARTPRPRSTCGLFCLIFYTIPHSSDSYRHTQIPQNHHTNTRTKCKSPKK